MTDKVGLSLLERFAQVKDQINMNTARLNEEVYSSNHKGTNQKSADATSIFERLSYFRELINLKEDENANYDIILREFFNFFEGQFSNIYNFKNPNPLLEIIHKVEQVLIENESVLLDKNNLNSGTNKKQVLTKISELFSQAEDSLKLDEEKENENMSRLKDFSYLVKTFARNNLIDLSELKLLDENTHASQRKAERSYKNREKLLSSVYLKKSKSQFGEEDKITPIDEEGNSIDNDDLFNVDDNSHNKGQKLVLINFLQIYLVKEGGIFSESYISKYDHTMLYSYRKYRYYEIKLSLLREESIEKISEYIETVTSLFVKYIIAYKREHECENYKDKEHNNKLVKLIFCGYGKKQSSVKSGLVDLLSDKVYHDCMIKISHFSNIFDCMKGTLRKCLTKGVYVYHSNLSQNLYKKLLKKTI